MNKFREIGRRMTLRQIHLKQKYKQHKPKLKFVFLLFAMGTYFGLAKLKSARTRFRILKVEKYYRQLKDEEPQHLGGRPVLLPKDEQELICLLQVLQKYKIKTVVANVQSQSIPKEAHAIIDLQLMDYFKVEPKGQLSVGPGILVQELRTKAKQLGKDLDLLPISFGKMRLFQLLNDNWGLNGSWGNYITTLRAISTDRQFFLVNNLDGQQTLSVYDFLGKSAMHGIITAITLRFDQPAQDQPIIEDRPGMLRAVVRLPYQMGLQNILTSDLPSFTFKQLKGNLVVAWGAREELKQFASRTATEGGAVLSCEGKIKEEIEQQLDLLEGMQSELRGELNYAFDRRRLFVNKQRENSGLHSIYRMIRILL